MSAVESHYPETVRSAPEPRHAPEYPEVAAVVEALAMENAQLREALQTREVIGRATGLLMAQRRCGPDEAFGLLTKLSQDTNTKLRDVARAFLDDFLAGVHRIPQGGPAAAF
ncbi:ANTAR domain-containing protein [Amycolatopsis sp. NPDC005232]|uniref:ANTAR domain-containing protein n=1 Tax=Amycolatopsis sp. NPDC005232 TaxID=3157027 RepID=UPI00339E417E